MAARLWLWARTWLSSCWVWAWAKPNSTAMMIPAVAIAPDSHGTHGTQVRLRFGRAWVLISGGSWRVRATASRTWARIAGGGSSAAAKASAVPTSRNPRTSLAQDEQPFMWRVNRSRSAPLSIASRA